MPVRGTSDDLAPSCCGSRPMGDRILWNRRPDGPRDGGDIDEIVVHGATVHIEQMSDRCWWIGITRPDGTEWSGNLWCNSRGHMRFAEQENDGVDWDDDREHGEDPWHA